MKLLNRLLLSLLLGMTVLSAAPGARPAVRSVVFIDAGVANWQTLAADVTPGTLVVPLDPAEDGVTQMVRRLAATGVRGLSAIQIVSHGLEGEVRLGSTILTGRNLPEHSVALAELGSFLAPGGDLTIYGCYVGHGAGGRQFLDDLAAATHADVAASSAPLGRTAAGPNWTLDRATGPIEAANPFGDAALKAYAGQLLPSLNGQLYYIVTNGATGDVGTYYINSDTTNRTMIGSNQDQSIAVDSAAGLLFTTNGKDGITVRHLSDASVIGTTRFGPQTGNPNIDDAVEAVAVDSVNHKLYVGDWGTDNNSTGIRAFTYNPFSGALTAQASNGGFLFTATQSETTPGSDATTRFTSPWHFSIDLANQKLYYADNDNGYALAPYHPTNSVYVVDLLSPTPLPALLTTFPSGSATGGTGGGGLNAVYTQGLMGQIAVDPAHNLVYFGTSQSGSVNNGGTDHANDKYYYVSATPTGFSQAATPVTLAGFGTTYTDHFYPFELGTLTLDPQNDRIYLTNYDNGDGTIANLSDISLAQISPDGHTWTLVQKYDMNLLVGRTLQNNPPSSNGESYDDAAATTFNPLPVLSLNPTTSHAIEQGAWLDLTAFSTSSDPDGGYYIGATVQITAGTFSAVESSANDDHLSVLDGVTNRTSGTVVGTNIAVSYDSVNEKLTLTGYDTIAHYNTVLGNVQYQATGDNPTNFGANPTRLISWQVSDGSANVPFGAQNSGTTALTIDAVNDPPVNTVPGAKTVSEEGSVAIAGISFIDVDAQTGDSATVTLAVSHGTLTVLTSVGGGVTAGAVTGNGTATVVLTGVRSAINTTLAAVNGLVYVPTPNYSGSDSLVVTTSDLGHTPGPAQQDADTVAITVTPIADTPSVTNATTDEDVQTTSGLVISRNPADHAEVTHFKITGITGGTLFKTDGTTSITNGAFITFAEGNAGLKFTPASNAFTPGGFTVQASVSNIDAGLGGGTVSATITVNPVGDTPSVTGSTTLANLQTTSGLVITRNVADHAEVTNFKITGITNGTLFQNDGTTAIAENGFITVAQGAAGLKFTPTPGQSAAGSFLVQAALDSAGTGLSTAATATITVNKRATATSIVSDDPDPSRTAQPVIVTYTVVNTDGGPAPTGTVTVTISGGSETCSDTVAAGQCTLTPTVAGVGRTITATYGGDGVSLSGSASDLHTVLACDANPVVTSNADAGPGSLRQAIADACAGDTITFSVASPIHLTSGTLELSRAVTISGPAADQLTVDGSGGSFRIFTIDSGAIVTISGLTISGGFVSSGTPYGGGIGNLGGSLTLANAVLSGNRAFLGGALAHVPAGGAGSLTVINTTFNDNLAFAGGAILVDFSAGTGAMTVTNSTISGNAAAQGGGGIFSAGTGTALTITNSTITNNNADEDQDAAGTGGGLATNTGSTPVILRNTLIAGNLTAGSAAADVSGDLDPSSAFNLIGADGGLTTGITNGVNNNHVGTLATPIDPRLGPLASNGGPAPTHALLTGSPAIDAGSNAFVVAPPFAAGSPIVDGRGTGFARIRDGADADTTATVDIGAVEQDPAIQDVTDKATNEGTPLVFAFDVGDGTTPFDSITATSSNPTLVPNAGANLAITGSGSTRTLTLTPAPFLSGTAMITLTAAKTLGGTLLTATDTFVVTVNPVDDPPTLNAIPNPAAILEDAALQTVNLSGITAGGGESQALTVSATSNNTALIPDPTVSYTSPNATGSLSYTPIANANGTATITVTVGDGVNTFTRTFVVAVTAVDDAPTVGAIADQNILQDSSTGALAVTVGDLDNPVAGLTLSGGSSNLTLVPTANITFGGSGANRTVTVTPAAHQSGTATITVNVSDGSISTPRSFLLTVASSRILRIEADLTFGSVPSGTTRSLTMTLANDGEGPLTVSGITYPANVSGDWAGGAIAAGSTKDVIVTFAPTAVTTYSGIVTVAANQTSGATTTPMTGTGTNPAPVITAHPQNVAAHPDSPASFTAAAVGSPAPTVQWQMSIDGGLNWADVAGATARTYTIAAAALADSGHRFRAVFTNASGTATTDAATLTVGRHARADLDGDGLSDLVVWHPSTGTWSWVLSSKNFVDDGLGTKQWGNSSLGDVPLLGDIDGDGKADLIVWRASTGTWYWLTSSSGYSYASMGGVQWGNQALGDVPLVGDFDGDHKADLAVWRASTGTWFWLTSSSGYSYAAAGGKQWGNQSLGDQPLVADIDGDGTDDLTVWRASTGTWYWLTSATGYGYPNAGAKQWGNAGLGDKPRVGDIDGDGKADLLLWRPTDGTWYWLISSSGYSYAAQGQKLWGNQALGDVALIGDFDGTGKAALTVWRASTGTWYWLTPSSGYNYAAAGGKQWGVTVDIPMVK